jgi:hypothetical protein
MAWLACSPSCVNPEHWTLEEKHVSVSTDWSLSGGTWTPTSTAKTTTVRRHRGLTAAAALAMVSATRRVQRDGGNGYSVIEEVTA